MQDLQLRTCTRSNCGNTFSVSPHLPQEHCGSLCRIAEEDKQDPKGKKKRALKRAQHEWKATTHLALMTSTLKPEIDETTALYGTQELGGPQNHTSSERPRKKSTTSPVKLKTVKTKSENKSTTPTLPLKSKSSIVEKRVIGPTPKKKNSDAKNTDKKIENHIMQTKGNIMPTTETTNSEKSLNAGTSTTPQSDSKELSTLLREERSGSISLLQDTSEHLIDLAHSIAHANYDEDGEIIKRAANQEVEVALKCFEQARLTMKTKLEYLKFGKDLLK